MRTSQARFSFLTISKSKTKRDRRETKALHPQAGPDIPPLRHPARLSVLKSGDRPPGMSNDEYMLGFVVSLGVAAMLGYVLPSIELRHFRLPKQQSAQSRLLIPRQRSSVPTSGPAWGCCAFVSLSIFLFKKVCSAFVSLLSLFVFDFEMAREENRA
ncbi:hypothetical protein ACLOJK_015551 [Asimina triloba]